MKSPGKSINPAHVKGGDSKVKVGFGKGVAKQPTKSFKDMRKSC
jgi:hypothetical protein